MIKIAIVDDETHFREDLKRYISAHMRQREEPFGFQEYEDAVDLLEQYDFSYDMIFLDIDMKRSNGMDTARKLRQRDPRVILVFETRLAQYAAEGYTVDAIGFLVKPLQPSAVSLVMTKALALLSQARKTRKLIVMDSRGKVMLDSRDIRYIEVLNHMLIYHTDRGEYRDWSALSQREKELTDYHFFRCHRCYLVNLDHVTGMDWGKDAVRLGEITLPMSKGKKTPLMDALMNRYFTEER